MLLFCMEILKNANLKREKGEFDNFMQNPHFGVDIKNSKWYHHGMRSNQAIMQREVREHVAAVFG